MSDLISRQAAIDAISHHGEIENDYTDLYHDGYCDGVYDAVDVLKDLPSAQRTGRWIDDELICKARCSVCGEEFSWMDNDMERFLFCPNCGCAMKGEEE